LHDALAPLNRSMNQALEVYVTRRRPKSRTLDCPRQGRSRAHRQKLPGHVGIVKMLENAVCCGVAEGYEQTREGPFRERR